MVHILKKIFIAVIMDTCVMLYTNKQCQGIIDILLKGGEEAGEILKKGISINTKNKDEDTALYLAAKQDNAEVVKFLLNHGAELHSKFSFSEWEPLTNFNFLRWAAEEGLENIVKFLVQEGANVYEKDRSGRTLLELAVLGGNERIVEYLLDFGVDANEIDVHGGTALHAAAKQKNEKVCIVSFYGFTLCYNNTYAFYLLFFLL